LLPGVRLPPPTHGDGGEPEFALGPELFHRTWGN
jgi:hypothetical protein